MTNYFKKKKFNVYVVNSDGIKFTENKWKDSQTYNYSDKNKSIISDKHIRKYHSLDKIEKLRCQISTWGAD